MMQDQFSSPKIWSFSCCYVFLKTRLAALLQEIFCGNFFEIKVVIQLQLLAFDFVT
jgi:hypothetical protein